MPPRGWDLPNTCGGRATAFSVGQRQEWRNLERTTSGRRKKEQMNGRRVENVPELGGRRQNLTDISLHTRKDAAGTIETSSRNPSGIFATYCLAVGSTSWSFSSTLTSSFAASRYLSTFLMIFSANTCRVCTRTTLQSYKVQWRTWSVLSSLTFTTLPKVPSPSVARILSAEQ